MTARVTHWIGGKPWSGAAERTGIVFDPATGKQTKTVDFASRATLDEAVAVAKAAFPEWRDASLTKRTQVLFAFRELLNNRKGELAEIITSEHGKVLSDALGTEVRHYLGEVLEHAAEPRASAAVVASIARQQALGELVETLDAMASEIAQLPADTPARELTGIFAETCDLLLATLADILRDGDPADRAILLAMTADRGEQVELLRARVTSGELGAPAVQASVLYALSLFERAGWLCRRMAGPQAAADPAAPVAAASPAA